MWEFSQNSCLQENNIPRGSVMKQTPPPLHTLNREKWKIPHVWFQKSKAGVEDRTEDLFFHPHFLSFSWQRRKNFPTFSKGGPWESFTNCQLSLWHWLLNQPLHPINLLLQILHMKLEKRANGRQMIHGFVVINIQIVRDPDKVREFQCRNFKGE